jgi:uncharacterized protein (TIGR00645 family)
MSRHRLKSTDNRQPWIVNMIELPIFGSRWVQAPLYFGLIIAQCVYVYKFMVELWHLISHAPTMKEAEVMLLVLGLVDVVMVANLLLMVIVGGYETFVSRLYLEDHVDKPEWLDHVDAGVLKVKLASAMVTISSIHLLKTFIDISHTPRETVILQIAIHTAFLVSVLTLVMVERLLRRHSNEVHP